MTKEKTLLNTREVSEFLNINEKMVYTLVADKGLPASKVTGKWLFPRHLVERVAGKSNHQLSQAGETVAAVSWPFNHRREQ